MAHGWWPLARPSLAATPCGSTRRPARRYGITRGPARSTRSCSSKPWSPMTMHQAEWGRLSTLICWEHWMPLARAAMHNLGEDVHIAAWPTVRESHQIASRHYAMEGRCFVLAAGLVQVKDDLLEGLERVGGSAEARELLEAIPGGVLNRGGSLIAAPDTRVIAQAGEGDETLLAELDLAEVVEGLTNLDTDGHYARPDVFDLTVDTRARDGVMWNE
jgi:nitrilase